MTHALWDQAQRRELFGEMFEGLRLAHNGTEVKKYAELHKMLRTAEEWCREDVKQASVRALENRLWKLEKVLEQQSVTRLDQSTTWVDPAGGAPN